MKCLTHSLLSSMYEQIQSVGVTGCPDHHPLENLKAIEFHSNTGPDPLENHKSTKPASGIIGSPAKRHSNGVSLAGQ